MKKNIEIITMIYKSQDYLDLIISELQKNYCQVDGWDVGFRVLANDASPNILESLRKSGVPHTVYNDPKPNDYYLNRVYRCWNHGASTSKFDNICFVNSDMVFSDGWLTALLERHDGVNIPCSRLVESGKLMSGTYGISKDFGRHPNDIRHPEWKKFASESKKHMALYGGLFMPCAFETKTFLETGGYPEGNIYADGPGTLNGSVLQSGDDWYFRKLEKERKMKHVTVFDSLVYHIQEGEKDV
jgi:hypothetical protein